ncbi:hypothetical protein ACP3V3_19645 [Vibrio sp. PNB22_3_1]
MNHRLSLMRDVEIAMEAVKAIRSRDEWPERKDWLNKCRDRLADHDIESGEVILATKRLIDSVWTVEFRKIGDGVEVISFNRENEKGYKEESKLKRVRTIETDGRVLSEIQLFPVGTQTFDMEESYRTHTFKVLNPQHIFSYK